MDVFTKGKRSEIMSSVRSKRTSPELAAHNALKGARVRHRMWASDLPGSPDVVVGNAVIFINGCFWHGCARHYREPKTNARFWRRKIRMNVARDRRNARKLRDMGYGVFNVWEHADVGRSVVRITRRIIAAR